MLRTSMSDARKNMHNIVHQICYGGERAVISSHGKPIVAFVAIEDLEMLERIEAAYELNAINEGLADIEAGRVTKHSDFLNELGIEKDVIRNRADK